MAFIKTNKGNYKFKQKNLFLGLKKINKDVALINLLDVKKEFDKENLYFGLIYGTLLGAIREQDFIAHDEDIDLFILGEDEEKFKELLFNLRNKGFELIRYERSGLYSISRNEEYIDIYVMKEYFKGIRWNGADNFICEKYLLETKYMDFKGSSFRVPNESEEFLLIFYGKNWKTPIKYTNYQESISRVLLIKMFFIVRRTIPTWLYRIYIKIHYKPRFHKLLNKCKEYNIDL